MGEIRESGYITGVRKTILCMKNMRGIIKNIRDEKNLEIDFINFVLLFLFTCQFLKNFRKEK